MLHTAGNGGAERETEREGSNLRCQSVTEIQDGHVVIVGPLVQTQIILQRVFQLTDKTHTHKKSELSVGQISIMTEFAWMS